MKLQTFQFFLPHIVFTDFKYCTTATMQHYVMAERMHIEVCVADTISLIEESREIEQK